MPRSLDLDLSDTITEVVGNAIVGGVPNTVRQTYTKLSEQLAATGAVATAIDGASAGLVETDTWAELGAIAGTRAGQPGQAVGPDAGTHTDPVVGGTVPNKGKYTWSTAPAGWRWIADYHAVTDETIAEVYDAIDLKAPLESPALTGTPTAPTAAPGTNTTQIATTAHVKAAIDALLDGTPGALDTLNELAAALGDDANFAATVTNALAGKVGKTGDETVAGVKTFSDPPSVPDASFAIAKTSGLQDALDGLQDADDELATEIVGRISELSDSLGADAWLGLGIEPTNGGTNLGTSTYVYAYATPGRIPAMVWAYGVNGGGSLKLSARTKSGDNYTRTRSITLTVVDGLNVWTAEDLAPFYLEPNEHLSIYGPSVISVALSGGGQSGGYYNAVGDLDVVNDSSPERNVRLMFGMAFSDLYSTQARIANIEDVIAPDPTVLGEASPVTGTALGVSTYVFNDPVPDDGMECYGVISYASVPGRIFLKVFDKSGNDFTQDGSDHPVEVPAGLATTILETPFDMASGQYPGLYGANIITVNGGTTWLGYWDNSSGGNASSFTDSGVNTTARINLGFLLRPKGWLRKLAASVAAVALVAGFGDTPTSFIIVWSLGQSNEAGRGTTLSEIDIATGASYKFTRSTGAIDQMADPTGNDAIALSGDGKGSFGPALAQAVLGATGGRVGIILINSAEGGTSITTDWGDGEASWLQAVDDWNDAVTAIHAAKLNIAGCCVSISLGETDADAAVSGATYKTAFLDLATRAGTVTGLGDRLPIVIGQTGTNKTTDPAGYPVIRTAQAELVRENDNVYMGWNGAKWLGDSDRALMIDTWHYAQQAYDEYGHAKGPVVAAVAAGLLPDGFD